jgi:hypothetical protein
VAAAILEHLIRMKTISRAMWITFIGTRSSINGYSGWRIGAIQAFMPLYDGVYAANWGGGGVPDLEAGE